jgi:nitroreductase family protein
MEFNDLIDERFSVRNFKKDAIEQEKLDKILDAGRIAPTARNFQPQRFYVLKTEEAFEKLGTARAMAYEAPVVIMVCADMNTVWKNGVEEDYNTSDMDCSIAATYMMLAAWNIGIGSVWIRRFDSRELHKSFELPPHIKPVMLLPIGYKTDDCKPRAGFHEVRNKIEDEVVYL